MFSWTSLIPYDKENIVPRHQEERVVRMWKHANEVHASSSSESPHPHELMFMFHYVQSSAHGSDKNTPSCQIRGDSLYTMSVTRMSHQDAHADPTVVHLI